MTTTLQTRPAETRPPASVKERKPKAPKRTKKALQRIAIYTAQDTHTVAVKTVAYDGAAPHRYTLDLAPARCNCTGFGINKDCSHRADMSLLLSLTPFKSGGVWVFGQVRYCGVCGCWRYESKWRVPDGYTYASRCGCLMVEVIYR